MTNPSHTPGPWMFERFSHVQYGADAFDVKTKDTHIAEVGRPERGSGSNDTKEANARLIAAAPCMLEALTKILQEHDFLADEGGTICDNDYVVMARLALSKASGEAENNG